MGREMLVIEREALRALSEAAFNDINHYLRPGHLKQLASILGDPEASDNDRFVAYDFLKNANIAAGGVLPMCQDTGTAIIMGKKGRLVFTDGDDEAALAEGARDWLSAAQPALFAARAHFDVRGGQHQVEHAGFGRRASTPRTTTRTRYKPCSSPRAAAGQQVVPVPGVRRRSSPTSACWRS